MRCFEQFGIICTIKKKNKKKIHAGVLLNVTLLHGCFSHFLNCTNDTKSRKAAHMFT